METGKKIRSFVVLFILLCVGVYVGIAYYYMSGFSFGTWINGVYCTGKSVEEVNEELLAKGAQAELEVIYPILGGEKQQAAEQESRRFVLDSNTVQFDYTRPLKQLLQRQRPLLWARNLFLPEGGYEIMPEITMSEEGEKLFAGEFLADGTVQAESEREACIRLEKDETTGFRLYNGKKNRFDEEKALQECITAIKQGERSIVLSGACYYDMEADAAEKEQEALYRELQEFLDFEIIYDMGAEQVRFDRKALVDLLETEGEEPFTFARGEEGKLKWDEQKIASSIDTLAEHYDTYGKPRQFTVTGGGEITLEQGNYGTQLNKKAEVKWLSEALTERKSTTHVPDYVREAYARGENDIGDTYIEINMTKQKLWFYADGKVEVETLIVTGNMVRRRATPEGVYYVYSKQKNRILRGPGYASHVNYWMPVKGGVGIHDALWRDEFGGEIYKKEGSHGCINLPLEAAENLYGMIEVGVPVVMYYEEEE